MGAPLPPLLPPRPLLPLLMAVEGVAEEETGEGGEGGEGGAQRVSPPPLYFLISSSSCSAPSSLSLVRFCIEMVCGCKG